MDLGRPWFAVAIVAMFALSARSAVSIPEATLQRDVFETYYAEARPVSNPANAVAVEVSLSILRIVDFDEDTNVVTILGFIAMTWKDDHLVWEPSEYDDIQSFTRARSDVWIPDIVLWNAFSPSVLMRVTKVLVKSDGTVMLVEPRRYQVHCEVASPTHATCVLMFGSWTGNSAHIALSAPVERVDASNYEQHRTWELSKTKVTHLASAYPCCPGETYDVLRFSISLKRRRDLNADNDSDKDNGAVATQISLATIAAVFVAARAMM